MSDPRQALLYAERIHADDDAFFHVLRVALAVSPPAQAVALLHDAVEDGPDGLGAVAYKMKLNLEEVQALVVLTRDPGVTYTDYIERIARVGGMAREIKLADLRDNLKRCPDSLLLRYWKAKGRLEAP